MTNSGLERALQIYLGRMKIEAAFRDLKSLLGLDHLMSETQQNLQQLAALTVIAYAVELLVGEAVRDELQCILLSELLPKAQNMAIDKLLP